MANGLRHRGRQTPPKGHRNLLVQRASEECVSVRRWVGHLHYFTKETALANLNDTGYQVIDYFYTAGSVELPNRGWKSNLLRRPRKARFRLNSDSAVRILEGHSLLVLVK